MGAAATRGRQARGERGPCPGDRRAWGFELPSGPPVLGNLGTKTHWRPGRPRAQLLPVTAAHEHASLAPRPQGGDVGPSVGAGWPALPRAVLGSRGGSHLAAPPAHFLTRAQRTPQTSPQALLHAATAYSAPPLSSESPSVSTARHSPHRPEAETGSQRSKRPSPCVRMGRSLRESPVTPLTLESEGLDCGSYSGLRSMASSQALPSLVPGGPGSPPGWRGWAIHLLVPTALTR